MTYRALKPRPRLYKESNDAGAARGFITVGHGPHRKVVLSGLYMVWNSMRSRCNSPTNHAYARYGGRGITICSEWDSFQVFQSWAHGAGYVRALHLDRIDNDGNYEPANCRWSTRAESMRNTSAVRLTMEIATQVRLSTGTDTQIGRQFGISREHARDIRNFKRWKI